MATGSETAKSSSGSEGVLSREQILSAAEDAFRRFGPAKTTVLDVARSLGVSHGSVYRHFKSKIALRNAVIEVWLKRFAASLADILNKPGTAQERLRLWLDSCRSLKTNEYRRETELFATYHNLAQDSAPVVASYYDELACQLAKIIDSGISSGEFRKSDAHGKAQAILDATIRFHHPWHAADWHSPETDEAFERVWQLILHGTLSPGKSA